jgi:hypothetical protein
MTTLTTSPESPASVKANSALSPALILRVLLRGSVPALLIAAAVLLLASIEQPYWSMHLDAPQYDYRDGLDIIVFVDSMRGKDPKFDELRELNSLNHYIGMRPLDEAATLERSIAIPSLLTFAVFLGIASLTYVFRFYWKFAWLLTLPAVFFPVVFVADLYYWLRDSGQNLDPTAAFSSTIKPFTPTMIGEGVVGQFHTQANLDTGWYMATWAAIFIVVALLVALVQAIMARRAARQKAA